MVKSKTTAHDVPEDAYDVAGVARVLGVSRWKVFDLIGRDPADPLFLASYQNSDGRTGKRWVRKSVLADYQQRQEALSAAKKRPARGRRPQRRSRRMTPAHPGPADLAAPEVEPAT